MAKMKPIEALMTAIDDNILFGTSRKHLMAGRSFSDVVGLAEIPYVPLVEYSLDLEEAVEPNGLAIEVPTTEDDYRALWEGLSKKAMANSDDRQWRSLSRCSFDPIHDYVFITKNGEPVGVLETTSTIDFEEGERDTLDTTLFTRIDFVYVAPECRGEKMYREVLAGIAIAQFQADKLFTAKRLYDTQMALEKDNAHLKIAFDHFMSADVRSKGGHHFCFDVGECCHDLSTTHIGYTSDEVKDAEGSYVHGAYPQYISKTEITDIPLQKNYQVDRFEDFANCECNLDGICSDWCFEDPEPFRPAPSETSHALSL